MDIDPETVAGTVIVFDIVIDIVFGTVYHAVGNEERRTKNEKRETRCAVTNLPASAQDAQDAQPGRALRLRVRVLGLNVLNALRYIGAQR